MKPVLRHRNLLQRVCSTGWSLRWAAAGQALTLLAMVLPIITRRTEQVLVLVVAVAISVFLLNMTTLSYSFTYPIIRGPRLRRAANLASGLSLLVWAAVLGSVAVVLPLTGTLRAAALPSVVLLVANGLYQMRLTSLIRRHENLALTQIRFTYGLTTLIATSTVIAADIPQSYALVLANSSGYLAAAAPGAVMLRNSLRPSFTPHSGRLIKLYIRHATIPTVSGLASGWVNLISGLAVLNLGPLAAAWAVVSRLCGGFGTLLQAVLVPPLEAKAAQAIRGRNFSGFAHTRRSGLLLGASVATTASVFSIAASIYVTNKELMTNEYLLIASCILLFWFPQLLITPLNRFPNFIGRGRSRLRYDILRAVMLSACFFTFNGVVALIAMGSVLTITSGRFISLTAMQTQPQLARAMERKSGDL